MKKYSIVVLAALVMIGCGSSSSKDDNKTSSATSEAQKLAYAIAHRNDLIDGAKPKKESRGADLPCTTSGSITVPYTIEQMQMQNFDIETMMNNITFNNCNNDGEILNGSMVMDLDESGEGRISFPQGFSVTGGDEPGSIKAGGTIDIKQIGDWEQSTINMEMTINGITHGGENLVYRSLDLDNGNYIEYPISGKEKIGDSSYFTVDPDYDASATPFKTNQNGVLLSGLFKYIDDNNHSVELEITGEDKVTVRVDEDGNGSFVGNEISTIDL